MRQARRSFPFIERIFADADQANPFALNLNVLDRLSSFAYHFNRRFALDSIVQLLAWAAAHATPHPYWVITAG